MKDRILICQVTLSLRQIVFGTWNRKDKYISAVLSFRKCKSHWCLFICTLFLATIVYSCTWHTWPMQITAPTSMHLVFPLLSPSIVWLSPILSRPHHLIHILLSLFLCLSLYPPFSIESWSTDYTVTFCFILSETPEGKPFQDISQQTNAPTLSLSWMWVYKQALSRSHTHTLFCFGITCVSLTCHNW